MEIWSQVKSKHREVKEGRDIWLLFGAKNNNIKLPKGTFGKIVYARNQVEADIWFKDTCHEISKALNLETGYIVKNSFSGVVLNIKSTDFALVYNHEKDSEIMIYEDVLCSIPFLDLKNIKCAVGNRFKENKRLYQYRLIDLIENIEEQFSKWVSELEVIKDTDDEDENLYVFTDEAAELLKTKQSQIIEEFANVTGIYYEFKGGTIEY
ncbi:hypothetical protein ABD91_26185 [Lysinibacillus sphaericus]|uniref:hypothetical protein n=1 Tax=Lysinibacillus sphaericus TaxID=1421 RepID=UPI0018CFAA84|nr:hypothetical protein [Lysinibacillus sphaericus]MBG9694222.1 hypothetical protein [Lysinibacillus sphaericus]